MVVPNWLRTWPHPSYGHCGGGELDCSLSGEPVDDMDRDFMYHDIDLYAARQLDSQEEIAYAEQAADRLLGIRLRAGYKRYARPFYGPLYRQMAMLIFRAA